LFDGGWSNAACGSFCQDGGGCVTPPSCSAGTASNCGSGGIDSCCGARTVPGGTFFRSYDGITPSGTAYGQDYPATVCPFSLDIFDVSVSRFRNFVAAYDGWSKPATKSGANPNDPNDTGWDPSWNTNLAADSSALQTRLACLGGTWTPQPGPNERLPVTCLDWYTALAFCIWDGGRLPTEAEWNFAAAGGADQRVYPWSSPADSTTITSTDAVYSTSGMAFVGSTTSGAGRWGHWDLAGNAEEWVRDAFTDPYSSTTCDNCANFVGSTNVFRGGAFWADPGSITASFRDNDDPTVGGIYSSNGVRCARLP
jgi:formylglycine-generating enzyme required for sulfatase activity